MIQFHVTFLKSSEKIMNTMKSISQIGGLPAKIRTPYLPHTNWEWHLLGFCKGVKC